jgi:hypothetical protein
MDVRKKVDQGNVPPRWEGLAAGQGLRSWQKAGWLTKTAREAWGQWESREHRQCAPEQGQHRMRRFLVIWRECMAEENACRYNILRGQP